MGRPLSARAVEAAPGSDGIRGEPTVPAPLARRVGTIWALLLLNSLGSTGSSPFFPRAVAQTITMSALAVAVVLALTLNRRLLTRSSLVLGLFTVLAITALMAGVRGSSGVGAPLRSIRLFAFLAVLWLLTPVWGRRDMLLAKCHLGVIVAACVSVVVGAFFFPSIALTGNSTGRLSGVLWPIPPTQVGGYAAVMAGMATALWLGGAIARRWALAIDAVAVPMIFLSRTRTATVALIVALLVAGLTLFLKQERVRRIARTSLLLLPVATVVLAPAVSDWFLRDQTAEQLGGLTGRREVWTRAVEAPRSELDQWLGLGLSDKSFDGLPIDSTWVAAYRDQGLIGVVLVAVVLVHLLAQTAFRPSGPARALATFLVVYCMVASYTEVTLGDVSPYLLHVVVAASLLTSGSGGRAEPAPRTAVAARPAGA